jgi:hypothetical protein
MTNVRQQVVQLCMSGLLIVGAIGALLVSPVTSAQEDEFDGVLIPDGLTNLSAIELYSQDVLVKLINQNQHLQRVKADECQLVRDIEARATVLDVPVYQFLWGDMLAWGVCVERDAKLGIHFMKTAAQQGLPAALEHLGRYHRKGILVIQDTNLALHYLRESAALGHIPALLQLVDMYIADMGSPYDFHDAYVWLRQVVTDDVQLQREIVNKINALEVRMSPSAIAHAQRIARTLITQ